MKIPPQDFRWCAAFHDEGKHPHVHMMAWSVKPGQAYLSKDGIRQIKSTLTNQIFKQEMLHLYEQKSESRDELVRETRRVMLELSQQMRESVCEHPQAEQMISNLARRLGEAKGTFATHALASGVDAKTLSGILGHTQASFTLDTYTHVTGDMQKRASEIVGGFMENIMVR